MPTNFPSFRHLRVQKCRHTKSAIKSSYSNILFCFLGNVAECSNRGRWPAPLVAQFGWVSGGPGCLGPCSQLLPGWLASSRIDCPLPLVLCGCHPMWGLPPSLLLGWVCRSHRDVWSQVIGTFGGCSWCGCPGSICLPRGIAAVSHPHYTFVTKTQAFSHSSTRIYSLIYNVIPEITQTQMDK